MKFAGGGSVSWGKADRALAKEKNEHLFVIGVSDGKRPETSIISMGVCDDATYREVLALITKRMKKIDPTFGEVTKEDAK